MILLYFAWQNRETPISISYGLGVIAAFFYTFGYAFQLMSVNLEQIMFWVHFQYIGILTGPFIWVVMILQFIGKEHLLTKRNLIFLSIGPLSTMLTHYTNEWHFLFYKSIALDYSQGFPLIVIERGPLFYMHIGYALAYHLFGVALLLYVYLKSNKERRKQTLLMIIGSLFVFGFPFLHSADFMNVPIDISPFGLIFSSVFYLWGIYRHNLLKLSPLAMKKVFESINDAVMIFDLENHLKMYNQSASRLLQRGKDEKLTGLTASELLYNHPLLLEKIHQPFQEDEIIHQTIQIQHHYYNVKLSMVDGSRHKVIGKMCIFQDITEAIKYEQSLLEQSQQFEYLAHHDILTGIYNRTYFEEEVKQKLAEPSAYYSALMLCDLNFFKEINDVYGHLVGDHVLMYTAKCWHEHLPNPHTLARLGGDEFIMFFEAISNKEQFLQEIMEARQAFKEKLYKMDTVEIEVVPSIGIAFVDEDGDDYEHLYHMCDVRMYEDKKLIKAQYIVETNRD